METLVQQPRDLADSVRDHFAWGPGTRVVVGFSGGPDSTALATRLHGLRHHGLALELHLAYVDHGWQPPLAAERTWRRVQILAETLGLPVSREPAPEDALPAREGPARAHRYKRLLACARRLGAGWIALGHHAGDQAETMLMRRMRGAGPIGRAGMERQRRVQGSGVMLARPMLNLAPSTLHEALGTLRNLVLQDAANLDPRHDRVSLRLHLAERHTPARLAAFASRMARRAERRHAALRARVEALAPHVPVDAHTGGAPGHASTRTDALTTLAPLDFHLALRMLGAPLHPDRDGPWLSRRHRVLMRALLEDGGSLDLPSQLRFHVRGKRAWLSRHGVQPNDPPRALTLRRRDRVSPAGPNEAQVFPGAEAPAALLDARVLGPRAILRPLREDDRFCPFGHAPERSTLVRKWLSKQGIPAFARARTYVVEGHQGIAWVVGHRIDARHALQPRTRVSARLDVS